MAAWVDITTPNLATDLSAVGYTATRWPGGSTSDQYHWESNSTCAAFVATNSTFDNFISYIATPAKLDVAVTLNYGSNAACNGGGDPTEAAAWVSHAKKLGEGVKYWTVGNEVWGNYEYDLHSKPHDPATYANAVATGYYPDIKLADPSAQVGVVVNTNSAWDSKVLSESEYDFVELHDYFTGPGQENDEKLLTQGPDTLSRNINTIKTELNAAGKPDTPIYLGELGSVYATPGKQAMSIVQGLYAGMVLGELMNDGVFRATWWLGFGGCTDASSGANFSSSLYGWQDFGGFMTLSDGTPKNGCENATTVARGTPFPTARAYQLMTQVARNGEYALSVSNSGMPTTIRSYAATHGSGYAIVMFNLDENSSHTANVSVDSLGSGTTASLTTYGKAQYDQSQTNQWPGPVTQSIRSWSGPMQITLPPWSMSVVLLNR